MKMSRIIEKQTKNTFYNSISEQHYFGKIITGLLKEDIVCAVATPQTCAGQESGIEVAIHTVRKSYEKDNS